MYHSKVNNNKLLLTLVVLVCWLGPTSSVRAPTTTIINKCCRNGTQLDRNQQCVSGGPDKWWPHIFLIMKQSYFTPRGDAPRFFKVREETVPMCDYPELFRGNGSMAIFSNGSLYLSERETMFEPENYCVDKDVAIVCIPKLHGSDSLMSPLALTKVRKCCGQRSAYSTQDNNCVPVPNGHEILSKKLINNSTLIDLVFGFPQCEVTNHFTIAEKFKESNLEQTTGSLTLDSGRQFNSNEFCLEHTLNDLDKSFVNVFTCVEHLSLSDSVPKEVIIFHGNFLFNFLFDLIMFILTLKFHLSAI